MKATAAVAVLGLAAAASARDVTVSGPRWGCGLLGPLPGITAAGQTDAGTQQMVDGLKVTSDVGLVGYWNWDLAPSLEGNGTMEFLSKDFLFIPDQWGVQAVDDEYVRPANQANFLDGQGNVCPATMANLFIGANEPDMIGSCMGSMMGTCTAPCTAAQVATGCPVATLFGPPASPLPDGHCDCWSDSEATGCGFWPVDGCSNPQPLPTLFTDPDPTCANVVMGMWRQTAATIVAKGYKYLSAPMAAVSMDWQRSFVKMACTGCSDISCGCPTHVAWHFYAEDCQPVALGGYDSFQAKLNATAALMDEFPNLMGAIINEVGMLNCNMGTNGTDECVPNGPNQKYPANKQPNNACPVTDELPNGFGSFVDELLDRVIAAKTTDGRPVVSFFSWFNLDMSGGTYNLRLFDDQDNVNDVGDAYIKACQRWAQSEKDEEEAERQAALAALAQGN